MGEFTGQATQGSTGNGARTTKKSDINGIPLIYITSKAACMRQHTSSDCYQWDISNGWERNWIIYWQEYLHMEQRNA